MAWKKTKKGKFSLRKEPPKSWRDRQLNERQNRVEMLRLHDEMVRRLPLATLALFTGAFADPPSSFWLRPQERSDSEGGRSRSSSLAA